MAGRHRTRWRWSRVTAACRSQSVPQLSNGRLQELKHQERTKHPVRRVHHCPPGTRFWRGSTGRWNRNEALSGVHSRRQDLRHRAPRLGAQPPGTEASGGTLRAPMPPFWAVQRPEFIKPIHWARLRNGSLPVAARVDSWQGPRMSRPSGARGPSGPTRKTARSRT